jgi:hypothetical protein
VYCAYFNILIEAAESTKYLCCIQYWTVLITHKYTCTDCFYSPCLTSSFKMTSWKISLFEITLVRYFDGLSLHEIYCFRTSNLKRWDFYWIVGTRKKIGFWQIYGESKKSISKRLVFFLSRDLNMSSIGWFTAIGWHCKMWNYGKKFVGFSTLVSCRHN